eukprot:2347536-Alexandrium_andersonii.AAC.1
MSASLVGSEMCIRDRPPETPELGRLAAYAASRLCPGPGSWRAPRAARTVSYTHLTLPTICSV